MAYKRSEWKTIDELQTYLIDRVFEMGYQTLVEYVTSSKNINESILEDFTQCKKCGVFVQLGDTSESETEDYMNNLNAYEEEIAGHPERYHAQIHSFTCDSCRSKLKENE